MERAADTAATPAVIPNVFLRPFTLPGLSSSRFFYLFFHGCGERRTCSDLRASPETKKGS